jgi:hypothetical protein
MARSHDHTVTWRGHLKPEIKSVCSLLVTHHALSRLAQRCNARNPRDLVLATHAVFVTLVGEKPLPSDLPPAGYHLPVSLPNGMGDAVAVLERHENADVDASVVVTVLPPDLN